MKIRLPRPRCHATSLSPLTLAALQQLASISRQDGGIISNPRDYLAAYLDTTTCHLDRVLTTLSESRHILLSPDRSRIAVLTVCSANIHRERVAARRAHVLGKQSRTPFFDRILSIFPALCSAKHKSSYLCPSAFSAILAKFEHHHYRQRPADVEVLTEAFYPGELGSLLTCIEEQLSARRAPILLFTRKAVYLSVRRAPKR